MNFIYPEQPSETQVKKHVFRIREEMERLGINLEKVSKEFEKFTVFSDDVPKSSGETQVDSNKVPPPSFLKFLTLFALQWRVLEAKENSNISPRMSPAATHRLCTELLGCLASSKNYPFSIHKAYHRLIHKHLRSLSDSKLADAENVGSKPGSRIVYSLNRRKGQNILHNWSLIPFDIFHYIDTGQTDSFLSINDINLKFSLLLLRAIRFLRKTDFEDLERYVHLSVFLNYLSIDPEENQQERGYLYFSGLQDFLETDLSHPISLGSYVKHSLGEHLRTYDSNPNWEIPKDKVVWGGDESDQQQDFSPGSNLVLWSRAGRDIELEKQKGTVRVQFGPESRFAVACGSVLDMETILFLNHIYFAQFNTLLAQAEIVNIVKERFKNKISD